MDSSNSVPTVGGGPEETSHDLNTSQLTETARQRYNFLPEILMLQLTPGTRARAYCPQTTREKSYRGVHVIHRGIKHIHRAYSLQKRADRLTANTKHVQYKQRLESQETDAKDKV